MHQCLLCDGKTEHVLCIECSAAGPGGLIERYVVDDDIVCSCDICGQPWKVVLGEKHSASVIRPLVDFTGYICPECSNSDPDGIFFKHIKMLM